ncbi:MAG TPA: hypothetical protein VLF18_16880 [Tahibacter sp.]|uniref:hypothetical protein n=1 Tax=Tahibacter sp. TaxID=2056211 RepID=UPI002C792FD4|nr:hypothetical protein [Tahibacter sp.]HSX61867.1 hypothetical protein [Tahibacter sp.]
MFRTFLPVLALGAATLSGSAFAYTNTVPIGQITASSLQYGGAVLHAGGWAGHHYLAPSLAECEQMLQSGVADHGVPPGPGDCPHAMEQVQHCSRRSMFDFAGPSDPDTDGVVTTTISVPARYLRDVGRLRHEFRIDEFDALLQEYSGK